MKCVIVDFERTAYGLIIRIEVNGNWRDGQGGKLADLVKDALNTFEPAAFCVDVRGVKGHLRADTLGGLLPELVYKTEDTSRPACVVAKGNTAKNIGWALEASGIQAISEVLLFSDPKAAMDHLRQKIM